MMYTLLVLIILQNVLFHASLTHTPEDDGESFSWYIANSLIIVAMVAVTIGAYVNENTI